MTLEQYLASEDAREETRINSLYQYEDDPMSKPLYNYDDLAVRIRAHSNYHLMAPQNIKVTHIW